MKIVSIGEITIDHYLRQNQKFVGGISLNFAVHAKRCGAETVSLVSAVGDDPEGEWVLATLSREQVDHSHVAIFEGKTATCDIEVFSDAERVFPPGGYHENTLSQLSLTEEIKEFINQHGQEAFPNECCGFLYGNEENGRRRRSGSDSISKRRSLA